MKKMLIILLIACTCALTACGNKHEENDKLQEELVLNKESIIEKESQEDEVKSSDTEFDIRVADYSDYFVDVNGCAVIYNAEENYYSVYNESMINTEVSPYSTFKIVSTLMGLKNKVLHDENSTMNYNGTDYSVNAWNGDLTLEEAFQTSCVWYFRQVIDSVGKEEVKEELQAIKYGNCDISEWAGSNMNPQADLNGFWLNSSLKISPIEQVNVLKEIFQNRSCYSEEQVHTLKNIMLFDEINEYSIYGKTGTNQNGEGWYVGVAQKASMECYFSIYLNSENTEKKVSGSDARKVIQNIFQAE